MARVTGIGGVFFKAQDPTQLSAWYQKHLGIASGGDEVVAFPDGTVTFHWRERGNPDRVGYTVWGPFRQDTNYFEPSTKPFMLNFRVDDLDGMLTQLRRAGVQVDDKVEAYEYGRFGWAMDPEGNRIELWEPAEGKPPARTRFQRTMPSDRRRTPERRLPRDRRTVLDRRTAKRRETVAPVRLELRSGTDRRQGAERRSASDRRRAIDRRVSQQTVGELIRDSLRLLTEVADSGSLDDEVRRDLDAAMFRLRFALDRLEGGDV